MSRQLNIEDYVGKLSTDLTSQEYHTLKGTFSSSQLKDMIKDPEYFHRKYIAGTEEREEIDAFNVGTYFHTAVLEPHILEKECAVYTGPIRSGKVWEEFKATNAGKCIITAKELAVVEKLVNAVKSSPVAMGYINESQPEVSAFARLYVMEDEIFARGHDGRMNLLTSFGWVPSLGDYETEEDVVDFATQVVVKVRADILCPGRGVIADLKSTTGNAKSTSEMQNKVASYIYDLSASFYLDIFTLVSGEEYSEFIWIFASKDYHNCRSFAASNKNKLVGRAKWRKAVLEIAKYTRNKWKFQDELGVIAPTYYNMSEWLTETGE